MEPERKDPEKDPQKVANEPSLKSRAPLVKVEEAAIEEGTPVEAEEAPGENELACIECGCLALLFLLLFF